MPATQPGIGPTPSEPSGTTALSGAPRPPIPSRIPLVLSILSVLLAGSALGLVVTSPGHAGAIGPMGPIGPAGSTGSAGASGAQGSSGLPGPAGANGSQGTPGSQGPQGSEGNPGPGAIINVSTVSGISRIGNNSCGDYPGAQVNFTVSQPGTVVVTATVAVIMDHPGTGSQTVSLNLGSSSTDCISSVAVRGAVGSSAPRDGYPVDLALVRTFTIASAGSYSYYVVGTTLTVGSDFSEFASSSMVGVYYPA